MATLRLGPSKVEKKVDRVLKVDKVLADAADIARQAAADAAQVGEVGEHLGVRADGDRLATHRFVALERGYVGWEWSVTVARPPRARVATVCEVVLVPGESSVLAPEWLPWSERIRPGDLGVGDIMPTDPDDDRLVPGYASYEPETDDFADEPNAFELGVGRVRVMSRLGREEAADRWHTSDQGPHTPLAEHAPASCGTCGFFLPLAGSMRSLFGVCGNMFALDDGRAVSLDHGCGAHSEALVQATTPISAPPIAFDDNAVDLVKTPTGDGSVDDDHEPFGHG
jgi:hypothetical protein